MAALRLTYIRRRGTWPCAIKADGGFPSALMIWPKSQTGKLLVEEVVRTKERNQILHFCMGELNPDYREALYLTYFEGMSYLQAAEVMGKNVKQITNMVYRGKESLRGLLEREGITNAE